MKVEKICFDLDGTLADLYAVENWLAMLRSYDETPYRKAKPLVNMSLLAKELNKIQKAGIDIVIITALSKEPTPDYDKAVIRAKKLWLQEHLPSVAFDELHFIAYTDCKNDCLLDTSTAILFDDEERHREKWGGESYQPADIFPILKQILKGDDL